VRKDLKMPCGVYLRGIMPNETRPYEALETVAQAEDEKPNRVGISERTSCRWDGKKYSLLIRELFSIK
jgi:hypothetical protein